MDWFSEPLRQLPVLFAQPQDTPTVVQVPQLKKMPHCESAIVHRPGVALYAWGGGAGSLLCVCLFDFHIVYRIS